MSLTELRAQLCGPGALVAGVLSGTSADGIDVGLARLRAVRAEGGLALAPPELLGYSCEPFEPPLATRLRAVLDGEPCGLRESALLSRDLGRAFGRAARAAAERCGLAPALIGSHGQTVWHHDGADAQGPATLQLGDGEQVAAAAGCAVVSDFRQADIAAGGQGAPLAPLADGLIFAHLPRPALLLNLGGIANLTWLGARPQDLAGFDAGPAGCLLDGLARGLLGAPCDRDGACAARGRADEGLVEELLAHPFFALSPPRSTGRDTFGESWVGEVLERARARGLLAQGPQDLLASATLLVARAVARSVARFLPAGATRLVVAGGGVHNRALMAALERECGLPALSARAAGVDPDAREALVFAVLAARCVLELPSTHPGATGARPGAVLGRICPAPPGSRQAGDG